MYFNAETTEISGITDIAENAKKTIEKSKLDQYLEQLGNWLVDKTFDIILAVIFLLIGFKVSKFVVGIIKKSFQRSGLEDSVAGFLLSLIKGVLYSVVVIMGASMVGFQVTSLVTILGTASLAIGLALQGSLANFAGGVLILLMKPFKVGDYIIENGSKCEGTVTAIDIFYTKLLTADNRVIVIPNGTVTANTLTNLTTMEYRRLEITVGVAYESDIKTVKEILRDIIDSCEYSEKKMDVNVFVSEFLDSSINMGLKFYVRTENYWVARWQTMERIKEEFDANGISIPFNQMEVSIKHEA